MMRRGCPPTPTQGAATPTTSSASCAGSAPLFGVVEQETVDTLNEAAGVTRAQAAAMYGGAMCGWDSPMADPKNYNEAGAYIGPEMEDKHGEE